MWFAISCKSYIWVQGVGFLIGFAALFGPDETHPMVCLYVKKDREDPGKLSTGCPTRGCGLSRQWREFSGGLIYVLHGWFVKDLSKVCVFQDVFNFFASVFSSERGCWNTCIQSVPLQKAFFFAGERYLSSFI